MIRQAARLRERVMAEAIRMCKALQVGISTYHGDETDALRRLEARGDEDLVLFVTQQVMRELDRGPAPEAEPVSRFDKTKRALNQAMKPLRGANTYNNSRERKLAKEPT